LQENEKDKRKSSRAKEQNEANSYKCESMEIVVKEYDREDAWRESGEESTNVFVFGHKIISNSLNDWYILLVHN
jgi:hypothetical protein